MPKRLRQRANAKASLFRQHPYAEVALGVETLAMGAPDRVVHPAG